MGFPRHVPFVNGVLQKEKLKESIREATKAVSTMPNFLGEHKLENIVEPVAEHIMSAMAQTKV